MKGGGIMHGVRNGANMRFLSPKTRGGSVLSVKRARHLLRVQEAFATSDIAASEKVLVNLPPFRKHDPESLCHLVRL